MQTMDQFSHDLTLALEETSRTGGVRVGRWGQRRRTRSTGNLPCAPQPTEDSSSSPAPNENQQQNIDGLNSMQSDSDDRHDIRLTFQKSNNNRQIGNFESDSLNENFSPARFFRPNTRRKRKFKRMAVEYETTPSTPGGPTSGPGENILTGNTSGICRQGTSNTGNTASSSVFPITGAVKKRAWKHFSHDSFRTNVFFCGKRKRSHRDRYHDYHNKPHSSSVPRQFNNYMPCNSFHEYQHKTRTRSFSSTLKPNCEKILPLNKLLISKIERIAQQQQTTLPMSTKQTPSGFQFTPINLNPKVMVPISSQNDANNLNLNENDSNINFTLNNNIIPGGASAAAAASVTNNTQIQHHLSQIPENIAVRNQPKKSGSFESTFSALSKLTVGIPSLIICGEIPKQQLKSVSERKSGRRKHKNHRLRREQIRAQFQFDVDPHSMECCDLNDFLSSSSLSSSDSEGDQTNESDREGDDELTDWPGNEAMVNFASKHDFKRKPAANKKSQLSLIKSSDDNAAAGGDDDTLMSGDEATSPPLGVTFPLPLQVKPTTFLQSQPITITNSSQASAATTTGSFGFSNNYLLIGKETGLFGGINNSGGISGFINDLPGDDSLISENHFRFPVKQQIESEMSGETSNPFLASPPCQIGEIREIRAGCRRIKEERPGFSIKTSVNERLARFLQDGRQSYIRLPDLDLHEHESLTNYAKLYSLEMIVDNGCAVLSKTRNTTQSVKVDQHNFGNRFLLSDFKRVRCYDGRSGSVETNESFNTPEIYDDAGGGGYVDNCLSIDHLNQEILTKDTTTTTTNTILSQAQQQTLNS